jgi:hypothetical protein
MLSLLSGRWIAALLGLGGLAMAQDGLIVDPWNRAVTALSAPEPAAAVNDRTAPRAVGVASLPVAEPTSGPTVVPLGPPLSVAGKAGGVVPIGPIGSDLVVDPWVRPAEGGKAQLDRSAMARAGHRDWAHEIDEIVDPWKRGPLAVFTDPIIVDPWAR